LLVVLLLLLVAHHHRHFLSPLQLLLLLLLWVLLQRWSTAACPARCYCTAAGTGKPPWQQVGSAQGCLRHQARLRASAGTDEPASVNTLLAGEVLFWLGHSQLLLVVLPVQSMLLLLLLWLQPRRSRIILLPAPEASAGFTHLPWALSLTALARACC
jgi:hypothetical protein